MSFEEKLPALTLHLEHLHDLFKVLSQDNRKVTVSYKNIECDSIDELVGHLYGGKINSIKFDSKGPVVDGLAKASITIALSQQVGLILSTSPDLQTQAICHKVSNILKSCWSVRTLLHNKTAFVALYILILASMVIGTLGRRWLHLNPETFMTSIGGILTVMATLLLARTTNTIDRYVIILKRKSSLTEQKEADTKKLIWDFIKIGGGAVLTLAIGKFSCS
jgi:hypothetical protein